MLPVLVALGAAVVLVAVVVVVRRRRSPDTVASFRRQIDALSAEARRPVVDQVTQIERNEADDRTRDRERGGDAAAVVGDDERHADPAEGAVDGGAPGDGDAGDGGGDAGGGGDGAGGGD